MKNLITLIILCLISLSQIQAQNLSLQNNTPDERYQLAKGQHELGLGFDFAEDDGLGLNINYRFAYTNRLHQRVKFQVPTFKSGENAGENNIILESAGLSAGLEYHIPVKKRWSIYFGIEAGIELDRLPERLLFGMIVPAERTRALFVDVFTGVKYHANNRLSFFAEADYSLRSDELIIDPLTATKLKLNFEIGALIKFGNF